jgi:prepilin-type processing-associated H-X9-DG protein
LKLYSVREGCYPEVSGQDFLARLYQAKDCPDLQVFLCRASGKKVGPGFATDYVANPAAVGSSEDAPDPSAFPVVWESEPFHESGSERNVLFQDGSVRRMKEADFQAMLAKGSR